MYKAIMICANFILGFAASALAAECKDGICTLPSVGEATYTVLSPVPESAVEPIKPAPRLKSLDGKTIVLVGGSFMANVIVDGEYNTIITLQKLHCKVNMS